MMDTEQERELIRKAGTDRSAFAPLYDEYYQRIFAYVLKRTASLPASQDITSEVFLKALTGIRRFKWKSIPFSAWLYRIANNEIANHYRKNGNGHLDPDTFANSIQLSEPSAAEEMEKSEEELARYQEFLAVQRQLKKLKIQYQEAITLRFFEKKKISEIAKILGKREGTVKSLLHRGLEKLKVLMEEETR